MCVVFAEKMDNKLEEKVENPAIVHSPMVNGVQPLQEPAKSGYVCTRLSPSSIYRWGQWSHRSFRCETQTENGQNRHNDRLTRGETSTTVKVYT